MSRLDDMAAYTAALIEIADSAPERIEFVHDLAETNVEQASEIGTEVTVQLNQTVMTKAEEALTAARALQAALAALARAVHNAGG